MTPKEATKLIVKEADVSLFSFFNLLSMGILASSMADPHVCLFDDISGLPSIFAIGSDMGIFYGHTLHM